MVDIADRLLAGQAITIRDLLDLLATPEIGPDSAAETDPVPAADPDPAAASTAADDTQNSVDQEPAGPNPADLDIADCDRRGPDRRGTDSDTAAADPAIPPAPSVPKPRELAPLPARTQPNRQGRPITLNLTMSMSTMCALDNLPVHLAGHGAMTAHWARSICQAANTVSLLVVDPDTGETTGISDRYRIPQALRDRATTLNQTCVWLGCGQPATHCDLDHTDPFNHTHPAAGGQTSLDNLEPLCRTHHVLKTHAGWTYHRNPDRSLTFTSPTHTTYQQPAEPVTLPGEWFPHTDTARTTLGPTDTEHTRNRQVRDADGHRQAADEDQPLTLGDHIRAHLRHQHTQASTQPDNATTPTTRATTTPTEDDPPPF